MANRDDLLSGAKRCLLEKGYLRTTARDIAAAAGVSLAAIGYHFGTKEALLTEALLLAIEDWDSQLRESLGSVLQAAGDPTDRIEATWKELFKTIATHRRLWTANLELFAQIDRHPEIRRVLDLRLQRARSSLASLFMGKDESTIDDQTAQTIGGFYHALLSGLILQSLIDPEHALSARDLTYALRTVAAGIAPGHGKRKRHGTTSKNDGRTWKH
jgi:AcrR family transcriptional regulator